MIVESGLSSLDSAHELIMNRSEPAISLSLALVVFVVISDGDGGARVGTIGGDILSPNEMGGIDIRGGMAGFDPRAHNLSDYLARAVGWRLPPGAVTSRIRPLMPRMVSPTSVVLPLWTTGRISEADARSPAFGGPGLNGLHRLAHVLRDGSIVTEANSEFRRALAADPLSHQMLGEGARLRALAMDELARESMADELPPIFALLPEVFTIEQLRNAISQVAHRPEFEAESSSNFRRRIVEFVKYGVLIEVNEPDPTRQKGRPAMRYRFVPQAWRRWLETRTNEPTMREMHQMRSGIVASRRIGDESARVSPMSLPMEPQEAWNLTPSVLDARPSGLGAPREIRADLRRAHESPAPLSGATRPAPEQSDAERVKQLEQMVLQLAQRFDAERGKLDAVLRAVQQNAANPQSNPLDKPQE